MKQRRGSEKESEREEGEPVVFWSAPSRHTRRHAPSRHTCRLCFRPLRHRGTLVVLPFIVCAITAHFVLSGRLRRHGTFRRLRHHGALTSPFAGIVHLFEVLTPCSFSNFSRLFLRHHGTSARSPSSAPSRRTAHLLTRCSYSSNFSQLFDLRHHGTSLDLRRHGALVLPFAGIVHLFRVL